MASSNTLPKVALSIRQPWATLVLMGRKTVEIRRWSTPVRGRIFLHAGKIADPRSEGWDAITEEWRPLTELRGGLIGTIELTDCIAYRTLDQFRADQQLHLNDPTWFLPPVLWGFRFAKPKPMKFHPCPGQVKFFPVESPPPPARRVVRPPG